MPVDEQHDTTPNHRSEEEDESGNCHSAHKGRQKHRYHAVEQRRGGQHDESHAQPGTTADAKDVGTGKRIAERCLQHQSTHGKGCSAEGGRERLWQTRLKDDKTPSSVLRLAPCQDSQQGFGRNLNASNKQVEHK